MFLPNSFSEYQGKKTLVYVFIVPNLFRLTRGKHKVFKHTYIPFSQNRLKYLKSDIFIVGMPKTGFTLRLLYDT